MAAVCDQAELSVYGLESDLLARHWRRSRVELTADHVYRPRPYPGELTQVRAVKERSDSSPKPLDAYRSGHALRSFDDGSRRVGTPDRLPELVPRGVKTTGR